MRSKLLLAAWLLAGTPAYAQSTQTPVDADAIVASIGYQVVTRSTLIAYRQVFEPGKPYAKVLQTLVDNRLLAAEARRYALSNTSAELEALRKQFPPAPSFDGQEWDRLLRERLLARKFLDFRFGDFVPVARDEVLALIKANPQEFKGDAMANEAKARARLLPAARAQREQAFIVELRDRGEVRTVADVMPPD